MSASGAKKEVTIDLLKEEVRKRIVRLDKLLLDLKDESLQLKELARYCTKDKDSEQVTELFDQARDKLSDLTIAATKCSRDLGRESSPYHKRARRPSRALLSEASRSVSSASTKARQSFDAFFPLPSDDGGLTPKRRRRKSESSKAGSTVAFSLKKRKNTRTASITKLFNYIFSKHKVKTAPPSNKDSPPLTPLPTPPLISPPPLRTVDSPLRLNTNGRLLPLAQDEIDESIRATLHTLRRCSALSESTDLPKFVAEKELNEFLDPTSGPFLNFESPAITHRRRTIIRQNTQEHYDNLKSLASAIDSSVAAQHASSTV